MALIPLKYNLRNLRARWTTTLLTVLVTAMVVCSSCVLFGMVEGLQYSQQISGEPLDLLVLRKGASSETGGGFSRGTATELKTLPGIAKGEAIDEASKASGLPDVQGLPLAAGELINLPVMMRLDGKRANLIIRGAEAASPWLRPQFTIVSGRYFVPGRNECIVGAGLSRRFQNARIGDTLKCGEKEAYTVVGLFTCGGSASESEVWTGIEDLSANTSNQQSVASVQLRAASVTERDALIETIKTDTRFGLNPFVESQYYADQNATALFLTVLGTLIAILLSIGALFAAANTMFAAVKSRTREIGTMRALGFSRRAVLLSFLGESLLLCGLGGLLGWLATLAFRSWQFGISDFNSFSERTIQLRFGPLVFGVAFGMTLAMGLFGGLFPAVRAVRLNVVKALREL